jgi:hypothetical protein
MPDLVYPGPAGIPQYPEALIGFGNVAGHSLPSRFLLALIGKDARKLRRLQPRITESWHLYTTMVNIAALRVAISQWVLPGDEPPVVEFVQITRQAFPAHLHLLAEDEVDMVIRLALNEPVNLRDMPGGHLHAIQQSVIAALVWAKELSRAQTALLLAEAESMAQEWGYAPPR